MATIKKARANKTTKTMCGTVKAIKKLQYELEDELGDTFRHFGKDTHVAVQRTGELTCHLLLYKKAFEEPELLATIDLSIASEDGTDYGNSQRDLFLKSWLSGWISALSLSSKAEESRRQVESLFSN